MHATLLSVTRPEFYHLAESKVERLRIDDKTVRFRLELKAGRPVDGRTVDVVAYLPRRSRARPSGARWRWFGPGSSYSPPSSSGTDRNELDPKEGRAPGPGNDELQRLNQTKDHAKQKEILLGMLDEVRRHPHGPGRRVGAGDQRGRNPGSESRGRALIDQAARIGARYGREMEIGAINVDRVRNIVGKAELEDLVLEYARKAVAMLRPSDSVSSPEVHLEEPGIGPAQGQQDRRGEGQGRGRCPGRSHRRARPSGGRQTRSGR